MNWCKDMGSQLMFMALDLTPPPQSPNEEDEDDEIWPAQLHSPLWGRLPTDVLFQNILPRLPFSCLLKLRAVSRSWQSLLSSSDFWCHWFLWNSSPNRILIPNPNPNPEPDPNATPYPNPSPSSNRNLNASPTPNLRQSPNPNPNQDRKCNPKPCLLLRLGHLPSRRMKQKSIRFVRPYEPHLPVNRPLSARSWFLLHRNFAQVQDPFIILSSHGGLLLLGLQSSSAQQLIICNPLIKARRELPNPMFPFLLNHSYTGLLADAERGEYTVILSGAGSEAYHSSSGRWQVIPKTVVESPMSSTPALLDGSFHWFCQQQQQQQHRWGRNVVTLSAYHAREKVVTSTRTQFPPGISFPTRPHIWKDPEGLQTVAMLFGRVGIWQLSRELWMEVKPLPPEVNEVIKRSRLSVFEFTKVGDMLCLSTPNVDRVFVYSIDLMQGHWTPHCPHSKHFVGQCVFQPCPTVV